MPPSAVVDASVLVSAFLFPGSIPGRVLEASAEGRFVLLVSSVIVEETRRSLLSARLRGTYGHDEEAVLDWCAELLKAGSPVPEPLPDIGRVCRDPDDDHVIAAALAAGADSIVTGDKDLLALGRHGTVRVLTARAFLAEIAPDV